MCVRMSILMELYTTECGGSKLLSSKEMDSANRVQILDEAVYISLRASATRKSMNQSILRPTIGK